VSGRLWFKPSASWEFQISSGRLKDPEALEPGTVVRSSGSVSWTRASGGDVTAVTAAYGRNHTGHGDRGAFLFEVARRRGPNTLYGRVESLQLETLLLATDEETEGAAASVHHDANAFTLGGARDLFSAVGITGGIGADVTLYTVPVALQSLYGDHPVSVHVFFRVRPKAAGMWNMRMGQAPGR
jgi:hypothetical protein